MGFGLLCYALWRFFQSIKDPEDIGSDSKAVGKRIGFFISGLVYFGLGGYALYQIFKPSAGSGGGGSKTEIIPAEYLPYLFYAVAIGLSIKAIFQLVKIYKGDFLAKFKLDTMSNVNSRKIVKNLGYAGLTARGVIVGIIAYFFFKAASTAGNSELKGTSEAFAFLRESSGPWLVGLVAFGLVCYGAYMFIMARYRQFDD